MKDSVNNASSVINMYIKKTKISSSYIMTRCVLYTRKISDWIVYITINRRSSLREYAKFSTESRKCAVTKDAERDA